MYPMGRRYLLPTRKRTRTIKEVLGNVVDNNKDEAKTFLQQVSTILPKRERKTSLMSNAFTAEEKAISPTNVLKRRIRNQKTSDSLDNLCVHGLMWMVTLLPSEKKFVSALLDSKSEVNAIYPTFAKKLGLWVRSII